MPCIEGCYGIHVEDAEILFDSTLTRMSTLELSGMQWHYMCNAKGADFCTVQKSVYHYMDATKLSLEII